MRSLVLSCLLVVAALPFDALAQQPAACLSPDPSVWPETAKPYFLIIGDTSGSMTACTTPPTVYPTECNSAALGYRLNSCGMVPSRLNDMKCVLRNTLQAQAGRASFALQTYASFLTACPAGACASDCGAATGAQCDFDVFGCTYNYFPGALDACGNNPTCAAGAGPGAPNFPEGVWRNGGNVVVGFAPDTSPSNTPEILKYTDGQCGDSKELFAAGGTPIAGSLQTAAQYLRAGFTQWSTSNYCPPLAYAMATPMSVAQQLCRQVNVILITDGDESCQTQAAAVAAAQDLYQNGVLIAGRRWPVKVYVINFAGGSQANSDQIAAAGGTTASLTASNEATLSAAIEQVVSAAFAPEVCDNADNNCNGCTDEGYPHYADIGQACCVWSTQAQRTACMNNYRASITAANPTGTLSLLPCTTAQQATNPALWLCVNPQETCDGVDNNGDGNVDEGMLKCGNPLRCPSAEVCNGEDDDCDGAFDESVCGTCVPSAEVCDGCDNDCDGMADNGITGTVSCGQASPANCAGTMSCKPPTAVQVGGCSPAGGYTACSNMPGTESCNGVDDDCDGVVDELTGTTTCIPTGAPAGLSYGSSSRCQRGLQTCNEACLGFIGPVKETCNGVDDDCDGTVDDVTDSFGNTVGASCCPAGGRCGTGACTAGAWSCVGDHLECTGGVSPLPETCNGVDDDCNGGTDDVNNLGAECTVQGGPGRLRCYPDAGVVACESTPYCGPDGGVLVIVDAGVPVDDAGTTEPDAGTTEPDAGTQGEVDAGVTTSEPDAGTDETDKVAPGPCGCSSGSGAPLLGVLLAAGWLVRRRRSALLAALVAALSLSACSERTSGELDLGRSSSAVTECVDAGCGDIAVDPQNCGACGRVCALANATARCADGQCFVGQCQPGFADIDGNPVNGCEASCVGDGGSEVCDGLDNDCDGVADEGFDTSSDPAHCGSCAIDCRAGTVNGVVYCDAGSCVFEDCAPGYYSPDAGRACSVACIPSGREVCDGLDNDCDGITDEDVVPPSVVAQCGVSPTAVSAECTSQVAVVCVGGAWTCNFPAGVCTGATCKSTPELCDTVDNNCDGVLNEKFPGWGKPCASDDAAPVPGHGACRTMGVMACTSPTTIACSAVKASCATLPGGCTEQCDGVDNDCDGVIDETFQAKGPDTAYFVKPAVTRIGTSLWVFSYEASRANATASYAGSGNGYSCSGNCPAGVPNTPAGEPLNRTQACSVPSKLPWFNVTPIEAEQTCSRLGGRICTLNDWQGACDTSPPGATTCTYGYAPNGAACTSVYTSTKFCNLGASYDFNSALAGDQDGLLPTASPLLRNCYADWTNLLGNGATNGRIFDVTGNLRELAEDNSVSPGVYRAMGGSYLMDAPNAGACQFTFSAVTSTTNSVDTGFRCCFAVDPTL